MSAIIEADLRILVGKEKMEEAIRSVRQDDGDKSRTYCDFDRE